MYIHCRTPFPEYYTLCTYTAGSPSQNTMHYVRTLQNPPPRILYTMYIHCRTPFPEYYTLCTYTAGSPSQNTMHYVHTLRDPLPRILCTMYTLLLLTCQSHLSSDPTSPVPWGRLATCGSPFPEYYALCTRCYYSLVNLISHQTPPPQSHGVDWPPVGAPSQNTMHYVHVVITHLSISSLIRSHLPSPVG